MRVVRVMKLGTVTTLALACGLALDVGARESSSAVLSDRAQSEPRRGIQVHGHWTIDVLEADGTVVSHREFENALVSTAPELLVSLLGHERTPGLWTVFLDANGAQNAPDNPCADDVLPPFGPNYWGCFLVEPNSIRAGPAGPQPFFKTLSVGSRLAGGGSAITLSGHATAGNNGVISRVLTTLDSCLASRAPSNCSDSVSSQRDDLTTTTVDPPISVMPGRIIQVSVEITFS